MKSAKELGQTMTTEENAEDITSDRFGLIYGSVCFRSPQEGTFLFFHIQCSVLFFYNFFTFFYLFVPFFIIFFFISRNKSTVF